MKEESLLLLSDLQKLINQVVLIDYTIIILGGAAMNMNPEIYSAIRANNNMITTSDVLSMGFLECYYQST